jgi:hypothetical protein
MLCMALTANSDFLPTQYSLTAFITETECVYCAVRNGSLNTILFFVLKRSVIIIILVLFIAQQPLWA